MHIISKTKDKIEKYTELEIKIIIIEDCKVRINTQTKKTRRLLQSENKTQKDIVAKHIHWINQINGRD